MKICESSGNSFGSGVAAFGCGYAAGKIRLRHLADTRLVSLVKYLVLCFLLMYFIICSTCFSAMSACGYYRGCIYTVTMGYVLSYCGVLVFWVESC